MPELHQEGVSWCVEGTNFLSWLTLHCVLCCVRYSAVCRPLAYRDSNITERTGTRVAKYVTPVIIFSTIYNIPKFLEYKVSNVRMSESDQYITQIKAVGQH